MQCRRTWWRASDNIADHTVEALILTRRCREIATCPTHTKPLSRQDGDVWAWTVRSTNQPALRAYTQSVRDLSLCLALWRSMRVKGSTVWRRCKCVLVALFNSQGKELEMRLSGSRRWKEDQRKVTRRKWLGRWAPLPFHGWPT